MRSMEIDVDVELRDDCPEMFRYHLVPDGRPVSVNVTEYVTRLNVTVSLIVPPFTAKDPPCAE